MEKGLEMSYFNGAAWLILSKVMKLGFGDWISPLIQTRLVGVFYWDIENMPTENLKYVVKKDKTNKYAVFHKFPVDVMQHK
jgi:hypothetical protein